jgi:cytochrome P450
MISTAKTNWESALVSPEFLQDPYPLIHQMREQEPVYWSDSIGGWILTRYDDIMATFKDTESFSNEGRLGKAVEYLPPEKRAKYKPFEDHYATKGLLHSDPPTTRGCGMSSSRISPRMWWSRCAPTFKASSTI